MEIERRHFVSTMKPAEVFRHMKVLETLSTPLVRILKEELEGGNTISSVSTGWPDEDSIVVSLSRTFNRKYEVEGAAYLRVNDPHYWMEEYSTVKPKHLLVC